MTHKHRIQREGDEYACSCGLRWDIAEDDPHGTPKEVGKRALKQLKKDLSTPVKKPLH